MSFKIDDESVHLKYTKICQPHSHSQPLYDDKYIKTKVKTFGGVNSTFFSKDELPKERNHYICIAATCIDSVLKVEKKLSSGLFRAMQIQTKEKKICRFYRC